MYAVGHGRVFMGALGGGEPRCPSVSHQGLGYMGGHSFSVQWHGLSPKTLPQFFFTPEQSADSSGHPSCLGESLQFFACFAFSKHSRLEDFTSRYQLFVESVFTDLYES